MAVNLSPIGNGFQFFTAAGLPLNGGLLNTYLAGSTTPAATYTTSTGNVQNANPIVLGTDGRPQSAGNIVEIWLTAGISYKFTLTDSLSNLIATYDNLIGINDIATSGVSEWIPFGSTPTFISATSFSVVGNQTATLTVGLRLKTTNTGGTIYSTITASSYSSGPNITTVVVANDSGTLDSGLSALSYGFLNSLNSSIPFTKFAASGLPTSRGYIDGLTLSTAGSSATMSIAAGIATASDGLSPMVLAAAIAKTTASWAVGTGNGGLDTGSIANATWYYFFLIQRVDTEVVDVLFSLSQTAPTMPTNYTLKRYIGGGLTNGSAQWVLFSQKGNFFRWSASVTDINATNPGTSAVTATLTVPRAPQVQALTIPSHVNTGASGIYLYISDLAASDEAAAAGLSQVGQSVNNVSGVGNVQIMTNGSGQIRYRISFSDANTTVRIVTIGWIDQRGGNV